MIKQKLKAPSFWLSVLGVIMMLLQTFGVSIPMPAINELISTLGASLVICGCLLSNKIDGGCDDNCDGGLSKTK